MLYPFETFEEIRYFFQYLLQFDSYTLKTNSLLKNKQYSSAIYKEVYMHKKFLMAQYSSSEMRLYVMNSSNNLYLNDKINSLIWKT